MQTLDKVDGSARPGVDMLERPVVRTSSIQPYVVSQSQRRGQRGEQRRQHLLRALRASRVPLLGSDLAAEYGVSRQILVQDIAILRASGHDVIATPRGYMYNGKEQRTYRALLHCKHEPADAVDEACILVDNGVTMVDVGIDHPVLGPLRADMRISSREELDERFSAYETASCQQLSTLTNGSHTHVVEATEFDAIEHAATELRCRGFLDGDIQPL